MNPHVTSGDAFVIFKKQKPGKEATFILRLDDGRLHSNLPSSDVPSLALQTVDKATYQPSSYQWATSRKSGRPHKSDTWELELKQGEKVKVFKDMGRDWFLVEGKRGVKGCVHGSWLDFGARKVHANPKSAYDQFQMDLQEWLASGQLCSFLNMTSYIDSCTKPECQLLKEDVNSIGICVHDLLILLEGSGKYSREWLKEHRNMWHPDRFARFCHPQHAQRLTSLAGQMFVYYGILMEKT
jgi:methylenetetrahydrofolate dehydrogenase (NADP+)/methenyltetrahydrofolate cyclohydrolase/formyltetrahydrofolate synthetase